MQWAAVKTYLAPINEPPHQNSTRLEPWRNMAASQGHSPLPASTPPTTRPDDTSCWPHSFESMTLPLSSSIALIEAPPTGLGGREMVCTGTKTAGRRVVVGVGTGVRTRFDGRVGRCVKNAGRCVVYDGTESTSSGQQTPGMNSRLKQSESRKLERSSKRLGHTLRSSHRPAVPLGVMHRFSPSLPSRSSIFAEKSNSNLL